MNRKIIALALLLVCGVVAFMNSCKKSADSLPLEPISIVQPDSQIVRIFAGSSTPLQFKFTTDRPIDWIKCLVDVDTMIDSTNYVPTYPDTLFAIRLDTLNPRVNLYTYTGSYTVPDTLKPFCIVRFNVSYMAGTKTFQVGQNYPAGLDSASKQFKINVR
ncbi:MAG: hypothetical protein JWO06_451 [Bacteroidota bacterium]|nr:hypothetical protein [Bacteroidota bacterium]